MRHPCLPILVALLFSFGGAPRPAESHGADSPSRPRKALYLGIDGVRFDALRVAKTPHLDSLMEQGCYSEQCLILGERYRKNDTISGPGWSTILTGVWADKHGVHDNTFRGKNYQEYPHFFARLKERLPETRAVSLVTWGPIDEHIVSHADRRAAFKDDEARYTGADRQCAAESVKQLAHPELTCLFTYFGQVDEHGHSFGFHPSVPEYLEAIERVDAHVGELLAAMRARKTYTREDWIVVVTSDHGGLGKGHGGGHDKPEILNSMLIVSGDSAERGRLDGPVYLVDAPVTVLTHLGVPLQDAWRLDGIPRGLKAAR